MLSDLPRREHPTDMGACLLADPPNIAPALKSAEAAMVTRSGAISFTLDGNPTSDRFSGFRQKAALMIDQHLVSPRKTRGTDTHFLRRTLTIRWA